MAYVHMSSFYTDFIPQNDQTIATKTYMQQKLRDMLVLEQLTKLQVPQFPMTENAFIANKHKFDIISKEFPLLNMIFVFGVSGKCLVLCNGNYKNYKNKDEAYRASYGVKDNQHICEHLVS